MGIGSLSRPAVFLDRDGVINRAIVRNGLPYPPRSVEELEVLPEFPRRWRACVERGSSSSS